MQKVKNRKYYTMLVLFSIVILGYHFLLREYNGDAVEYFSKYLESSTLSEVLLKRYMTWTSRILIEIPLILFSYNLKVTLWSVCNIGVWMLLAFALMYLTHHKNDALLLGLMLIYPVSEMSSAGWMPTYINYLWPLTAGCVALISLDKMYYNKKIYWWEGITYLFFELFACNFETVGVMYTCILTWYIVHLFINKKANCKKILFWLISAIVAIGNVIFALTCPGNAARKKSNIAYCFKDFVQWTAVDKSVMGISTTMQKLFDSNMLFLIFLLVLFLCYCLKKKNKSTVEIVIGVFPLFFALTRTILKPFIAIYFPVYNNTFDSITKVDAANYNKGNLYAPFITYILLLSIIAFCMINAIKNIKSGIKYTIILAAGIITRVIMGFSPTLYVSSNRTFIFLDFTIIFLTVYMYSECVQEIKMNKNLYMLLKYSFVCIVGISIIGNLMAINH